MEPKGPAGLGSDDVLSFCKGGEIFRFHVKLCLCYHKKTTMAPSSLCRAAAPAAFPKKRWFLKPVTQLKLNSFFS